MNALSETLKNWEKTLKETAITGKGTEKILAAMVYGMIKDGRTNAIMRQDIAQSMVDDYPHTRGYVVTEADYRGFIAANGTMFKILFTDEDGISAVTLTNAILIDVLKQKQARDKRAKAILN